MSLDSNQFNILADTIRRRRTTKNFEASKIEKGVLEEFLNLAVMAPNHRMTQPWRFRVVMPSGIEKWIQFFKLRASQEDLAAFQKYFDKLPKLAALIAVTNIKAEPIEVAFENDLATSAAIQNLLLSATAANFQNFWSTGKFFKHSLSKEFLKINDDEKFLGALWIGKGQSPTQPVRIAAKDKTIWIE